MRDVVGRWLIGCAGAMIGLLAASGAGLATDRVERVSIVAPERSGDQKQPAVAFSPRKRQFLVVWEDNDRRAIDVVFAELRGSWARPSLRFGSPFAIGRSGGQGIDDPAIATDDKDRFLVVWSEEREQAGREVVMGALVDKNRKSYSSAFVIHEGCPVRAPNIAYGSGSDRWLVVWSQNREAGASPSCNAARGIRGVFLDGDARWIGPVFPGSPPGIDAEDAYPGYDSARQTFLVAHEVAEGAAQGEIHGRIIDDRSGAPGADLVLSSRNGDDPVLAYDRKQARFLAVWENEAATPDQIQGRFVAGTALGPVFDITAGEGDVEDPAIALAGGNFLVVWGEAEATSAIEHVKGQWLRSNGTAFGPRLGISSSDGAQDTPTDVHRNLACAHSAPCLALWEEREVEAPGDIALRLVTPQAPWLPSLAYTIKDRGRPGGGGPGKGDDDEDDDLEDDDDGDDDRGKRGGDRRIKDDDRKDDGKGGKRSKNKKRTFAKRDDFDQGRERAKDKRAKKDKSGDRKQKGGARRKVGKSNDD